MQDPKKPTVAAIISNYNYARFVSRAISSVLSQSVSFDEIFVVDDGSTDNSLEIIKPYQPRITVITKKNGGHLSACIAGIRASACDYVYFLDADDWIAPEMLMHVMPALSLRPAKVQFQLRGVDADGKQTGSVFPAFPQNYGTARMIEDNRVIGFYLCPPTSGNLFRKDLLDAMPLERFNARDSIDGTPMLVMPYLGEVVTIARPLAYYCMHDLSDSQALKITEAVLTREIDRFGARWDEAGRLLAIHRAQCVGKNPFFLAERKLMVAALQGRWFCFGQVTDFIGGLWKTSYSPRQKTLLTLWGIAFIIPVARLRKGLASYRRAGTARPAWLQKAVSWINRSRQD